MVGVRLEMESVKVSDGFHVQANFEQNWMIWLGLDCLVWRMCLLMGNWHDTHLSVVWDHGMLS